MKKPKLVPVQKYAMRFCALTVTLIVWAAWLLESPVLLMISVLILGLSAFLKIRKAPLIVLYSVTIGKMLHSPEIIVNENAIRFAHLLGTVLNLLCLAAVLRWPEAPSSWGAVLVFAVIKTISAAGFCPASRMYSCVTSGQCCALSRLRKPK